MKTAFYRSAALTLFLLVSSASAHAQLAATNHKVILRRDPSTSSPVLARLSQGARLVLVDSTPDGDTHGWLKLDPGSENLLNSGNINDEGGNLVFEIICKFPVTQADAKAACQNYTDHVKLPPVGSHVRIVGRYVQDTFHGQWNEIHPVSSITQVP